MSGFSFSLVSQLLKNRFQFCLSAASVSGFQFKFYPRKLFYRDYELFKSSTSWRFCYITIPVIRSSSDGLVSRAIASKVVDLGMIPRSVYFTENSGYRSLKNRSCVTVFGSCSVALTVGEPLGDVSSSANHNFRTSVTGISGEIDASICFHDSESHETKDSKFCFHNFSIRCSVLKNLCSGVGEDSDDSF